MSEPTKVPDDRQTLRLGFRCMKAKPEDDLAELGRLAKEAGAIFGANDWMRGVSVQECALHPKEEEFIAACLPEVISSLIERVWVAEEQLVVKHVNRFPPVDAPLGLRFDMAVEAHDDAVRSLITWQRRAEAAEASLKAEQAKVAALIAERDAG